jgi:CBS domain-containing protein
MQVGCSGKLTEHNIPVRKDSLRSTLRVLWVQDHQRTDVMLPHRAGGLCKRSPRMGHDHVWRSDVSDVHEPIDIPGATSLPSALIRIPSAGEPWRNGVEAPAEVVKVNVGQMCRGRVVKVAQNTPLSEVARVMRDQHVGAVMVTNGDGESAPLAGIITDRDIVSAQLEQAKDLGSLNAGAVMTRNVLTLSSDESLDGAIAHMRAKSVRRAPVVSAEGVPLGLVSTDDVIAQLSSKLVSIAGIVSQQSRRNR